MLYEELYSRWSAATDTLHLQQLNTLKLRMEIAEACISAIGGPGDKLARKVLELLTPPNEQVEANRER